jgi:hypothetical protein
MRWGVSLKSVGYFNYSTLENMLGDVAPVFLRECCVCARIGKKSELACFAFQMIQVESSCWLIVDRCRCYADLDYCLSFLNFDLKNLRKKWKPPKCDPGTCYRYLVLLYAA